VLEYSLVFAKNTFASRYFAGVLTKYSAHGSTRAQIKDPEKVTNKMYGGNTDISSHFFRIFNLRPSILGKDG